MTLAISKSDKMNEEEGNFGKQLCLLEDSNEILLSL